MCLLLLSLPCPYTTLFRSGRQERQVPAPPRSLSRSPPPDRPAADDQRSPPSRRSCPAASCCAPPAFPLRHGPSGRSEEHTSELQSRDHLVCRPLLEKKQQK